MNALAWSLIHFLWQGAAIAAVAAALMCAFRTPGTRYLIGISSLALMLLTFGVTFGLLAGSPATDITTAGTVVAAPASPGELTAVSATTSAEPRASTGFPFAWLSYGWLSGVLILALRIAFGLVLIEYLRRRNLIALPDALVHRFRALQARLGIRRAIRYHECHLVDVPAVIGFFRPIVLLPVRAITGLSLEQIEALVAHELGHIKRCDVLVNFFQVLAETLFFFHPAVWWLNKRIRADREDCCDDIALANVGNKVDYARALALIAEWRDVPRFAMAATGGSVGARIARVLGVSRGSSGERAAGVFTASLILASALIAGAVSLALLRPAEAEAAVNDMVIVAQVSDSAPAAPAPVEPKPAELAKPARAAAPATAPSAAPTVRNEIRTDVRTSFIDELKSVGIENVDVDTLVALKVHNVTAELVRELRIVVPDIEVDEIIPFAVHQVTPDFVKQVRSMGIDASAGHLVAMRVHDVSPDYVKSMRDLGFKPSTDELIAMKVHDIDPEYVRTMRAAGFDADSDDIIALKVHGVTPEYRQMLESAGLNTTTDQVIHAKVMDITPEFIAKARTHGFKDLKLEQLIALKNANVL